MKYLVTLFFCVFSVTCNALVVLQYHHVSDTAPKSTSISPSLFRAHMQYLEDKQFRIVDILTLKSLLKEGKSLPDRAAVITFDDAYHSVYRTAFPELKKRGWPFALFINTKAHDEKHKHFVSWEQLREMSKHGAVVANHTDSHPHLIRQQRYESYQQWQSRRVKEIEFAESRIKKEIGASHALFAYPYGEYDSKLMSELKKRGYIAFGQQSGPIATHSSHQILPRFAFGGAYGDISDFATKVNSIPFPESRIKVLTSSGGKVMYEPLLSEGEGRPILQITSPLMPYLNQLACYATGMGKISAETKGDTLVTSSPRALPPGRSRYNCTAHAGGGRYYWHSQLFIKKNRDGSWPKE